MSVSIEDVFSLVVDPFEDEGSARAALTRALTEVPDLSLAFRVGQETHAFFLSETQITEVVQNFERSTLRAWPLKTVQRMTETYASRRALHAGAGATALNDCRVNLIFKNGDTLEIAGSVITDRRTGAWLSNLTDAIEFLQGLARRVALHAPVESTWPT